MNAIKKVLLTALIALGFGIGATVGNAKPINDLRQIRENVDAAFFNALKVGMDY